MGGWMPYQRMRGRNGLLHRKPDDDPDTYPRQLSHPRTANAWGLIGDLNRMERDYLNPVYPEPPWALRAEGSDPSTECARAIGVDVETVRAVLRYVFLEQV